MESGPRRAVSAFAVSALLIVGALVVPSPNVKAADQPQIDQMFKQAQNLWREGQTQQAAETLKKLLAENPSSEAAYELLNKAEFQMFLDMLEKGGDAEQVAKAFLERAHLGEMQRTKNPAEIKALVAKAVGSSNPGERDEAVRQLEAKHGEYAVPYLYPYLGSNDTDERVYASVALSRLSLDAVLPLTQVLQSKDPLIAKNAALLLEKIGDVRAIGGLAELAATAQNAAVKAAASEAADSLLSKAEGLTSASPSEAYLWLAQEYYRHAPEVIHNYLSTYTVWSFHDGKLTDREVPKYIYHLILAQNAAYDALHAGDHKAAARAWIAAVQYAEWGALENLSEAAKSSAEGKMLIDTFWNVMPVARSQGTDTQLAALAIGLQFHDGRICRGALASLPGVWDGRAVTGDSSIVAALSSPDKTVRFAAAIAALEIQPEAAFKDSDKVMPIAAQAAAAGSLRQVLLIEPNAEIRTKSLQAMEKDDIYGVAEATGIGGFMRAKEVGTFDAIVIRATLPHNLALQIVQELHKDFRTAGIPILISGTKSELSDAKQLFGNKVQGYVSADPLDVAAVKTEANKSMNDDQKRAVEVSRKACEALAAVDSAHTPFKNFSVVEDALDGVVKSDKPDDIKVAALSALEALGTESSVSTVEAAFAKSSNSVAVRVGAASALGGILSGAPAPDGVYKTLLDALSDSSKDVRLAAGSALGSMKLTEDQRDQILNEKRVE